jgi:RNA polymerase sigma-70 factor (ECF subfamily)
MDRSLVERAQLGDHQAFAHLAMEASDRLYAVALRVLRDPDAAADALQAALVAIWRDLPMLRDPDRFEAWSYRVVARACQRELKRVRHGRAVADLFETDEPVGDAQLSVSLRDELERAFKRLTSDQRAVLVLMYYRDLSVAEIAVTLGISEGTAKSRLHYARAAMRAAVEADSRASLQEGQTA